MRTSCLCAMTWLQNSHLRIWLLKDPVPWDPVTQAKQATEFTGLQMGSAEWPAFTSKTTSDQQLTTCPYRSHKRKTGSGHPVPPLRDFPVPFHRFHTIHFLFQEVVTSVSFEKANHVWRTRWVYLERGLSWFPALCSFASVFFLSVYDKKISPISCSARDRDLDTQWHKASPYISSHLGNVHCPSLLVSPHSLTSFDF